MLTNTMMQVFFGEAISGGQKNGHPKWVNPAERSYLSLIVDPQHARRLWRKGREEGRGRTTLTTYRIEWSAVLKRELNMGFFLWRLTRWNSITNEGALAVFTRGKGRM